MANYSVAHRSLYFLGVKITDLQAGTPFSVESEQHTTVQFSADGEFDVSSTDPSKAKQGRIQIAIMGMSPTLNAIILESERSLAGGRALRGPLKIVDDNNGIDIVMDEATLVNRPTHRAATNQIEPTELIFVGAFRQIIRNPAEKDGGFSYVA